MLRLCLCMLAGAYALSLCRELPSDTGLFAAIATTAVCFCIRGLRPIACMLLGLVMMWVASRDVMNDRLLPELQGKTLTATVTVVSFPEMLQGSVRFAAETVDAPVLPGKIRLSWYDAPEVPRLGQTWRLQVRLRRPRGFANDTGFDYELWLARQRIGATGYVLASPSNARMDGVPVDGRSRMRARLVDRIMKVAGENDATAVLLAISVGAVHLISKEQWERYAISGTSHLMAISGLHIGLAAGGAWLLCRLMIPVFCRSANIRDLAAAAAVVAACAYAEISGFAIPARRAMLMALLVMLAFVLRRQLSPVRVISASCVLILATDPLAIHAAGFKLSFGAVALLLWRARQHCPVRGGGPALARRLAVGLRRLLALQLVLLFGLLPMSALIFGRMSWMAPAVNLVV
ncbi:MAG TPA: ComEC/Rec2 family competence protein, partial [Woeseiaceae bacterium]